MNDEPRASCACRCGGRFVAGLRYVVGMTTPLDVWVCLECGQETARRLGISPTACDTMIEPKTCPQCHVLFEGAGTRSHRRFCDDRCKRRAGRQRVNERLKRERRTARDRHAPAA